MVIKRLSVVAIFFLLGYLAIDVVVVNRDMILAERVLQIAACITVIYVYWPDAMLSLWRPHAEKGDYLIIGIVMGQFFLICQAMFAVIFRLSNNPGWLINADINGLWILGSILASSLHVLAPGAISGTVPQRSRVAAGCSLGSAAIVALFLLIVRPDIGPAVEKLRPFIADWFGTG